MAITEKELKTLRRAIKRIDECRLQIERMADDVNCNDEMGLKALRHLLNVDFNATIHATRILIFAGVNGKDAYELANDQKKRPVLNYVLQALEG